MKCGPLITRFGLTILLVFLMFGVASAHRDDTSYIQLSFSATKLTGHYEMSLQDAGRLAAMDGDGNGRVSRGEFDAASGGIYDLMTRVLAFAIVDEWYDIKITGHSFANHGGADTVLVAFEVAVPAPFPDTISIEHASPFDEVKPTQRVVLMLASNARSGVTGNRAQAAFIFEGGIQEYQLQLAPSSSGTAFLAFLGAGTSYPLFALLPVLAVIILALQACAGQRGEGEDRGEGSMAPAPLKALSNLVVTVVPFTLGCLVGLISAAGFETLRPGREMVVVSTILIVLLGGAAILPLGRSRLISLSCVTGAALGLMTAGFFLSLGPPSAAYPLSLAGFGLGFSLTLLACSLAAFLVAASFRQKRYYDAVFVRTGVTVLAATTLLFSLPGWLA